MFYLNMSAIMAISGMVVLLTLTRFWPQNKRVLLLLFNVAFLAFIGQVLFSSYVLFIFHACYALANYLCFVFLCRIRSWRRFWFLLFVCANVAMVVYMRVYMMNLQIEVEPLYLTALFLGIIYNLLKIIDTYYFAYYVGREGQSKLIDYINFVLFIPTFTSGPILKFRDFIADAKQPYSVDLPQYEAGIKRVILGLFKKIVVVVWMFDVFHQVLAQDLHTTSALFLMVWFYALVYFDFSGYSDIAIGFGRMFGYTVPENFKKPFLSPTLSQYWRNWHATLGDWFRDHIFMIFARKNPSRWLAAGLSLIIMVLIGLWHGFHWFYVLWGVYHGILLGLENLFRLSIVHKRKVSKLYFYFRCAVNQVFITLAVVVYSGNEETVMRIYRGLFQWPSYLQLG